MDFPFAKGLPMPDPFNPYKNFRVDEKGTQAEFTN
jgi:hypothetical protein